MSIKLSFVLKRRPHLSRREFQDYWINKHAPLVASLAKILGIQKYVQLHTLEGAENSTLRSARSAPEPYDGVAELWVDPTKATGTRDERERAGNILLEDEKNFIELKESPLWLGKEHLVVDDGKVKIQNTNINAQPKIAVIGAGVNGLWSAISLLQNGYKNVTLIAERWSPTTTSDAAFGLWGPAVLGTAQDVNLTKKWAQETWKHFVQLRKEKQFQDTQYISGFQYSKEMNFPSKYWEDWVIKYSKLSKQDLEKMGKGEYSSGCTYTTIVVDTTSYLVWSLELFRQLGGKTKSATVSTLSLECDLFNATDSSTSSAPQDSLPDSTTSDSPSSRKCFDVVVNCTGLASGKLCNDNEIYPVRGQSVIMKAPKVTHFETDEDYFIVPRNGLVFIRGPYQKDNWNTNCEPSDIDDILTACRLRFDSLDGAQILFSRAGLRPARPSVRLEMESDKDKRRFLVHNYGHGGSGITLHKGCANEVVNMLNSVFRQKSDGSQIVSKI